MKKIFLTYCLAAISTLGATAQTLTVFPGDANNSGLCNHVDVLFVGYNQGQNGPPRQSTSIVWQGFPAQPWPQAGSPNLAYSDCDGSGLVDRNDFLAIQANYGLLGNGFFVPDSGTVGGPASPPLIINIVQDTVNVQGSTVVNFDIGLGDQQSPISGVHGIAFSLSYDPGIVDMLTANVQGGWINYDSTAYVFLRNDSTAGRLDIAVTRVNQVNASGYGTIGSISIVMDDNIRFSGNYNLIFETSFIAAYNADFSPVFLRGGSDTLVVVTGQADTWPRELHVGPVPAHDQLRISNLTGQPLEEMGLYDIQGRQAMYSARQFAENSIISTDQLPSGCYFLELQLGGKTLRKKILIQHN
jgi:hypothetical protein